MTTNGRIQSRAGFTLIEVLVTLILVALLVAAVFPVVTQQTNSAAAPRLANDLSSVRTGIDLFYANVREYPLDVDQLVGEIGTSSNPLNETGYSASEVRRWNGPYVDLTTALGATVPTSYNDVTIANDFTLSANSNNAFVEVNVDGLTENQFADLNDIIDGEAETTTGSSYAAGKLRAISSSPGNAIYLAVPYAN